MEEVDTGTAVGMIHVVDALCRNRVIDDGEGLGKGVRLVLEVVDGLPGDMEVDVGKEYACLTVILEMGINDGEVVEVVGLRVPVSMDADTDDINDEAVLTLYELVDND